MIKYCVPSYHRADGVTTLNYLHKAKMYVSPEDYEEYIKCNPEWEDNIIKVPHGVQGKGKGRVMNWLLDNLWDEDTEAILIIDDDVSTLMAHRKNSKHYQVPEEEFYEICESLCLVAKEWGCGMWSFGLNAANTGYSEFAPFRTLGYLDGGLQGFVENDGLRYDEELTVKEDVDMFLQQIQKYHKALRCDKWYWKKKSFAGTGGSQEFRKDGVEKEQFKQMQKKWGSSIIRPNKPTSKNKNGGIRELGGAIKVKLPIKGI